MGCFSITKINSRYVSRREKVRAIKINLIQCRLLIIQLCMRKLDRKPIVKALEAELHLFFIPRSPVDNIRLTVAPRGARAKCPGKQLFALNIRIQRTAPRLSPHHHERAAFSARKRSASLPSRQSFQMEKKKATIIGGEHVIFHKSMYRLRIIKAI